jgi:hypothetical protein
MFGTMEDPLRTIADAHGVFLRREAIAAGYTDKMLAALRRRRVLHRVRHGCYCFMDVWTAMTIEQQHLTLARAVLRVTPGPVVLSHVTALVAHGVVVWGVDLGRVDVTRLENGAGRVEADVRHHVGACAEDEIIEVDGLLVVTVERALVETAMVVTPESALVSADAALHAKLCDPDDLRRSFARSTHWSGSRYAHTMLRLMDGRAESVGESRARWLFVSQGLPEPDLQFEVYDEQGVLVAVTDFVWHERKAFGEFDGKVKYTKLVREGEDPGEVVFREKQREDLVRRITGYGCGRLVWANLGSPTRTAAYFRQILGLD